METLDLNAIARVEHPSYPLEWYLLAINPDDELCTAILHHSATPTHTDIIHVYLGDLAHVFLTRGLDFETDRTFKKQSALRLWNKLTRITQGNYNV